MLQVKQIFDESQQRFGAEKIRIILAENGIRVGKKRIRGIMQKLGLESIRENAKKDYKKRQEYQQKNLLAQNFTASHQNEIWVSDITYFKVKDYSIYLCVIIDLFSRKIVGYCVSRKCSVQLVSATFKEAFQNRGRPSKLTFHSDRGGQYISRAFCALLRKCEVKQSFSKSGCPHDNAVAEAFFSTFKEKKPIAMNILRRQNSEKVWKHMSTFTTMSVPIRPWRTRLRRDLKSCMEKNRHRIYEKSRV